MIPTAWAWGLTTSCKPRASGDDPDAFTMALRAAE